ncbi:fringe glycosyltransferase [Drosophila busckii]|uniref:fringe glycosyltransferase n=1 Tax=Drosophila busckii TaxID=30019 RepID=UPI001432EEC7|nr:fringe glycosyltransferase [Drosophila busckii]
MMSLTVLSLPQRYKRLLQAMSLAVAVVYMTLLLYQSAYGYPGIQLPPQLDAEVATSQPRRLEQPTPTLTQPVGVGVAAPITPSLIIRKDIHSFNFSDIEVSERPAATLLTELAIIASRYDVKWYENPCFVLRMILFKLSSYREVGTQRVLRIWGHAGPPRMSEGHTKGHLINTKCSQGHFRKALCCKMSAELDVFLQSGKKWFCHFDDDNYVNVPRLVKLLDEYSPSVDWYLGKPSISSPLEIHLDNKNATTNKKITFWFATGGAGFCLSRALTLKMLPIAGGGKFISIGDKIRFPDDVTMGFIIEHLLKVPLTVVDNFHSHLEPMEFIRSDTFQDQVSFSYAHMKNQWNVIKVDGFDLKTDPKRFYSLHCQLFPYFSFCPPR